MGIAPSAPYADDSLPVANVSWFECERYCRETGLDLPTEAQWEYACRSGKQTAFGYGEQLRRDQANCANTSDPDGLVAVDSFPPTSFGLHNMHGNVAEWCKDGYDTDAYDRRAVQVNVDPFVAPSGNEPRVVRGGDQGTPAGACLCGYRSSCAPQTPYYGTGFRPVLNLHVGTKTARSEE